MTLKPGEICGFYPVAVRSAITTFEIVKPGDPHSGSVCFGVLQYPPGWPNGKPLSPTGSGPGNYWYCAPWNAWSSTPGETGGYTPYWQANNAFGAVYGQPVVLNFSTATIRTQPQTSDGYYDTLWYYG